MSPLLTYATSREGCSHDEREFDLSLSSAPTLQCHYPCDAATSEVSLLGGDGEKHNTAKQAVPASRLTRAVKQEWKKLRGWRFGVAMAAISTLLVLGVNLTRAVAAAVTSRGDIDQGIGTIYDGRCATVSESATLLHVFINALSSMLLGATNYTMQALCSPTRTEVDKAHSKGDWLDIGVPSIRNIMGRIPRRRIVVWWLLALTSVPIHLVYNSVIFRTIDNNDYTIWVADEAILNGKQFCPIAPEGFCDDVNPCYSSEKEPGIAPGYGKPALTRMILATSLLNSSSVQRLTNVECIKQYGTNYLSGRSNVLLMTSTTIESYSSSYGTQKLPNQTLYLAMESAYFLAAQTVTYEWICGGHNNFYRQDSYSFCDLPRAINDAANWVVYGYDIEYCLSQVEEPHCKLQFSLGLLVAVIIMNAAKAVCMLWILFEHSESTLVTFGDAVTSFLHRPDRFTKGHCLLAKSDLRKRKRGLTSRYDPDTKPLPALPQAADAVYKRTWHSAADRWRWISTICFCMLCLGVGIWLLEVVNKNISHDIPGHSIFDLGFGKADPRAVIQGGFPHDGVFGLMASVLVANLPQAVVSLAYLSYNGLFTSMVLASEWSRYYVRKQPLRVTAPQGKQRSTYYLHLPYAYSVPLLMTSAVLHWLLSESIFLVRIDTYQNRRLSATSGQVGFSCLPILVVLTIGAAMVLTVIGNGFRKFTSCMPVAGSCSMAITAACHPPRSDSNAAYLAVSRGEVDGGNDNTVGHCTFTSLEVKSLTPARLYS